MKTEKGVLQNQKSLPRFRIEVLDNGASIGSYLTDGEDKVVIGSAAQADFIIPIHGISKIHAMIRIQNQKDVILYDLGSEQGTYVLGSKVIEKALSGKESIRLGHHELRVELMRDFVTPETTPEHCLFWAHSLGNELLSVNMLDGGKLQDIFHVEKKSKLITGQQQGSFYLPELQAKQVFLQRSSTGKAEQAECFLPQGFRAEIYDKNNKLAKTISESGKTFSFTDAEKVLLLDAGSRCIQLYWHESNKRLARGTPDKDAFILQRSILASLALALAIFGIMNWNREPEAIPAEIAETAKSSYFRLSTDSAPSSAPASEGGVSEKTSAVSNMLSKFIQKTTAVAQEVAKISNNGLKSVRASSNFNKQDVAASETSGTADASAVSAGLKAAAGSGGKGLNGFSSGGVVGVSGMGGNGKGFSLNVGGEEAEASGGLDKAQIAAVVQANLGQIKHCYERQLLIDSTILGKVVAQWTINGNGIVATDSIKKTTMNNQAVESCILAKIKTWEFPKPKGGGQVLVSYPFLFKSTN